MKRRNFIKNAGAVGAGTVFTESSVRNASAAQAGGIKNILVLFVDQQRQDCIGSYGNSVVKTPNIDRLARNGVRFTNCYTPGPVCTPARTSFQCGLWPHHHRLILNSGVTEEPGRMGGGAQNPSPGTKFFSHTLRDNNWQAAHVGKWHIGTEKSRPVDHGYDGNLPFYPGYGYPSNHPHYLEYLKQQGVSGFNLLWERKDPTGYRPYAGLQEGPQSASIPAYLASQTVDTIQRYTRNDAPFFIACNFWGPHAPYNITKEHLEMYRGKNIKPWPNWDCDLSDKPGVITRYGEYWKTGWFNDKDLSDMIGEYYGYITLIDDEIGRILKALEDAGELDSTLIIYTADHGSSVGSYRYWDKGFGMYDCITRIPLIISNPSLKPSVSDAFVTLNDMAATILDAGGLPSFQTDGTSLMPIVRGEKDAVRENYIITEHHGHQQTFWQRMVRTPSFKYIYNPTSRDEFYDLEKDPWETKNIFARADKDKVEWAKKTLLAWMEETKDPCRIWALPMLS